MLERIAPGLRLEAHQAGMVLLFLTLAVITFGRALTEVGLTKVDGLLLFLVAPLVVTVNHTVWEPSDSVKVAVNSAGFTVPFLLCVKFLVTRRAPWGVTLFTVAVVTLVSYWSSYAIPHEGVLIHYRIPALSAAALAVLLRWGMWTQVGPVAYVGGAIGVIIGADLFHLQTLLEPSDVPHRIILGGAGVLDGIYLVALLAVALTTIAMAGDHAVRAGLANARRQSDSVPPPPPGPRAPAGGAVGRRADG